MDSGVRLGQVYGIEIRAAFSWFIVFILVTGSLAAQLFPQSHPEWDTTTTWAAAVLTSLLFFGSILAHELGHSLVAVSRDVRVKRITLFIFGGLAQIESEPDNADDELVIALAGPLVSAVLAGVFWAFAVLFRGWFTPAVTVALWLARINALVLVFNMVPGFPLDGGRVLRAVVWRFTGSLRRATRYASLGGQIFAYLLIAWGLSIIFLQGGLLDGLWLAFIGWFLLQAAVAGRQQVELRELLEEYQVRDIMQVDCPQLAPGTTVEELVYDHVLGKSQRGFVVVDDNRVKGIVTMHHVKEIPQNSWSTTLVDEIMIPFDELKSVEPDDNLSDTFNQLSQVNQLPVVEGGELVGFLSREHVMEFMRMRSELKLDKV